MCRAEFPAGAHFCPHDGQRLEDLPGADVHVDPLLGCLIDDRYRIDSQLGVGGMGVVYAARHVVIDKPMAIKVLRQEYCSDPGMIERFIREARAASRIGHPNIVDVTDFGSLENGQIYFVMEYLDGSTLSGELRRLGSLPILRTVDLSSQVCHALKAAHDKGIVHRDLKPENVFIVHPSDAPASVDEAAGRRSDFVKLLDFGIAKISWGPGTRLTKAGSIFGTPQYMSPEQAAGQDADHRGDIYALGCIVYEMVTGEVPFTAETFMGTLTKHMFEQPQPPRALRPDIGIPEQLESAILIALSKDPGERFQSAEEMNEALARCALLVPGSGSTFPPGDTLVRIDRGLRGPPPASLVAPSAEEVASEAEAVAPASAAAASVEQAFALAAADDDDDDDEIVLGDAEAILKRETRSRRPVPPTDQVRQLGSRRSSVALPMVVVVVGALLLVGILARHRFRGGIQGGAGADAAVVAAADGAIVADAGAVDRAVADQRVAGEVRLQIETEPSGASVSAGGRRLGPTPTVLVGAEGERVTLLIRRSGYRRHVQSVTLSATRGSLRVRLRRRRNPLDALRSPPRGWDRQGGKSGRRPPRSPR